MTCIEQQCIEYTIVKQPWGIHYENTISWVKIQFNKFKVVYTTLCRFSGSNKIKLEINSRNITVESQNMYKLKKYTTKESIGKKQRNLKGN